MRASRIILVVAAWLAVVAVGSVLVWSVMSRAGDVESGPEPAVPAATATSSGATASPSSPAPSSSSSPSLPSASPGGSDSGTQEAVERRTWQGSGGYVSVECRGAAVSLVAAQADAGFAVEVEERGPEEVKVVFEGQGEEGSETEVVAMCRAGVPAFEASAED